MYEDLTNAAHFGRRLAQPMPTGLTQLSKLCLRLARFISKSFQRLIRDTCFTHLRMFTEVYGLAKTCQFQDLAASLTVSRTTHSLMERDLDGIFTCSVDGRLHPVLHTSSCSGCTSLSSSLMSMTLTPIDAEVIAVLQLGHVGPSGSKSCINVGELTL